MVLWEKIRSSCWCLSAHVDTRKCMSHKSTSDGWVLVCTRPRPLLVYIASDCCLGKAKVIWSMESCHQRLVLQHPQVRRNFTDPWTDQQGRARSLEHPEEHQRSQFTFARTPTFAAFKDPVPLQTKQWPRRWGPCRAVQGYIEAASPSLYLLWQVSMVPTVLTSVFLYLVAPISLEHPGKSQGFLWSSSLNLEEDQRSVCLTFARTPTFAALTRWSSTSSN